MRDRIVGDVRVYQTSSLEITMIICIDRKHPMDLRFHFMSDILEGRTIEQIKTEDVSGTAHLGEIDLSCISISQAPVTHVPLVTGMERIQALRTMHPNSLLDAQVFAMITALMFDYQMKRREFTALDHLKKYNAGNDLGPMLTFDGSVFYLHDDDETMTRVFGIRCIASKGGFVLCQPSLYSLRSTETQRIVYSLIYEPRGVPHAFQ